MWYGSTLFFIFGFLFLLEKLVFDVCSDVIMVMGPIVVTNVESTVDFRTACRSSVCEDCGSQEHGEARCPHPQWQSETRQKQEPGQSLL